MTASIDDVMAVPPWHHGLVHHSHRLGVPAGIRDANGPVDLLSRNTRCAQNTNTGAQRGFARATRPNRSVRAHSTGTGRASRNAATPCAASTWIRPRCGIITRRRLALTYGGSSVVRGYNDCKDTGWVFLGNQTQGGRQGEEEPRAGFVQRTSPRFSPPETSSVTSRPATIFPARATTRSGFSITSIATTCAPTPPDGLRTGGFPGTV